MNEPDVMVYLMTGFLDSGKTQFLTFTLKQDYFQIDGKTLLILCEEGEEEYDPMEMLKYGVVIERVEDQEDLTAEWLQEMEQKHEPERVVVEYNGMWKVSDFENLKLPDGWGIEQKLTTVDASTFQMYLTNLKPLFVEMVRGADLVLFNRCEDIKPLAGYRRSVKVVSPQAEVIFEDEQGEIENIFEDEVPYDLNASVVEIAKEDLNLRGVGDFIGTRQSGKNNYMSLIMANQRRYAVAKDIARELLDNETDCQLVRRVLSESDEDQEE